MHLIINNDNIMTSQPTFSPDRLHRSPSATRLHLEHLLRERAAIEPLRCAVPMLWALLDAEIARAGAAAADAKTAATLSSLAAGLARAPSKRNNSVNPLLSSPSPPPPPPPPAPSAAATAAHHQQPLSPRKRVKLPVPADKYPEYNFVGRLLGPRGTTLKTLERDTGCKIMIRGKGSIRKDKEPDVRGKPGWEHVFNEALHVVIEVADSLDDPTAACALNRAKEAVELLLVPVPEERDGLKRQQLRALAIMNGTYRGANVSRPVDHPIAISPFSTSPAPSALANFLDDTPNTSGFLGDSVATTLSSFEHPIDDHSALHSGQFGRFNSYHGNTSATQPAGGSPTSGATSPQTKLFTPVDNYSTTTADLSSKMRLCAVAGGVDEFGSSSVGDDSPDSSRSSEDGDPSSSQLAATAAAAQSVRQPKLSPRNRSASLGVGGFLGQEFYNGAFSNGPAPSPWDQQAAPSPSPAFSSPAVYGLSPLPSPQLLTKSSSTVTPLGRHGGY